MPATAPLRRTLLDRLGVGASVLCLVHCLLTPFLLTGVAAFGTVGGHEAEVGFHLVVFALALPLAVLSAWPGYREHRDRGVLAFLGGGIGLLVLSFVLHDRLGVVAHTALTAAGSVALIAGHLRNYRLRPRCATHVLPHHAAHDPGADGHTHP